jgi:D-alanine-D-alanine ligase
MNGRRVAVLLGGLSAERSISLRTGAAIARALRANGHDVVEIDVDQDLALRLKEVRPEVAFIALHGSLGEDGCVQGLLEVMGIPYTGSGVCASAVAMDKRLTKELLKLHGISTPGWLDLSRAELEAVSDALPFGYPAVVKPNSQGSTVGIHIVNEARQLGEALADSVHFDDRILVEQYIPGREVTVGVLNGQVLPVLEVVPKSGFYDFESKYTPGQTDYLCPAPIGDALTQECQRLGLRTYQVVGCEGAARVDIRINPEGQCFVLEINTIPGMTETSLIPKAAAHIGKSFGDVCESILAGARLKVAQQGLLKER